MYTGFGPKDEGEQAREEIVHFVGLDTQARVDDAGGEPCGGWYDSREKASPGWRPFPSPVEHILSDLSTMTPPSWVAPRAWLSFIELDKAVVLV